MKVTVLLVKGVEGDSIQINGYRICGPKAWGGGKVLKTWTADTYNILEAIKGPVDSMVAVSMEE